MGWTEVGHEIFSRRYPPDDVTVTVVRGGSELLLVDTGGSPSHAARVRRDARPLGDITCVVNTHAHYDHTFGNQCFGAGSGLDLPVYGHHLLPAHLDDHERPRLAAWRADHGSEPFRDWDEVVITAPTHLVRERTRLDLAGRAVELIPLDPGHTDGDLVLRVPAARTGGGDTWIVGDVLEEPGPPMHGSGCHPLQWPRTLAALLEEVGEEDVLLPGHGRPVSRAFARAQLSVLDDTARLIRAHHRAGDDVESALSAAGWAYPPAALRLAVERGYSELAGGRDVP